jgi:Holliday junction resolvase RusA-like endonuclease
MSVRAMLHGAFQERRMISFYVHGLAETKGSWRSFGKRMVPDNPRAKAWEQAVGWCARAAWSKTMPGLAPVRDLVEVTCTALLPEMIDKRRDRDVDKLARAALDAMQGIIYVNDKQVVTLYVEKIRGMTPKIGMMIDVELAKPEIERWERFLIARSALGLLHLPE